jgi:outer membrane receptor for ferrienterochelin and colicin
MRSSTLFALLAVAAIAGVACEGRHTLTGPDAQRAYAQVAAEVQQVVPAGPIVFVDGKRMPAGTSLDQMDPKQITRIEVVKGAAAVGLYGEEGRRGVINIFTRADSTRR